MKPKESKGYLDLSSPTTVGSTAAVIAIGGLVAASSAPIIGTALAVGGAGVAAFELYRKMADEEESRKRRKGGAA